MLVGGPEQVPVYSSEAPNVTRAFILLSTVCQNTLLLLPVLLLFPAIRKHLRSLELQNNVHGHNYKLV